jgi:hydrogenase/urease accessory protein HupE
MRRRLAPLLAAPAPALAHDLSAQYGAFLGPALHVFTEIDHLGAFLAVGLLAGQQAALARTIGLIVFGLVLVCGITAPFASDAIGALESIEGYLSPASLLVAGVLVAIGRPLPAWLVGLASGALGLVHGLANGLEFAADALPAVWMLGAGVAAALVVALGTLLAATLDGPRGRIVVRVLGSWLAALGLMLLGLALAPK